MSENPPGGTPRDPDEPGTTPDEPGTTPRQPGQPDPFTPPAPEPPGYPSTPQPAPYEPPPGAPGAPTPGAPAPGEPPAYGAEPSPFGTPPQAPTYGAYGSSAGGQPPSSGTPYGSVPPASPYPGGNVPAYGGQVGGYGVGGPPFRVGEALRFGWERFKGNVAPWVLYAVVLGVVNWLTNNRAADDYTEQWNNALEGRPLAQTTVTLGAAALSTLGFLVTAVLQALAVRAALREVSGEKPTFASFFTAQRMSTVIVAAVVVGLLTLVGLVACILPGILVAVFATFTYHNVHDRGLGAWAAFSASFRTVAQSFGSVFLLLLASFGLYILGAIPCGLGLLVVVPVVTIAIAYAYRRLTGGPVAAPAVAPGYPTA